LKLKGLGSKYSSYVYDLAGRLIVEALPLGQYKRAFAYLYDLPVVMHSTLPE